jgi:hypothetical protein
LDDIGTDFMLRNLPRFLSNYFKETFVNLPAGSPAEGWQAGYNSYYVCAHNFACPSGK